MTTEDARTEPSPRASEAARWWIEHTASLLTTAGLATYVYLRYGYERYFEQFNLGLEHVGFDFTAIVSRGGPVLGVFLALPLILLFSGRALGAYLAGRLVKTRRWQRVQREASQGQLYWTGLVAWLPPLIVLIGLSTALGFRTDMERLARATTRGVPIARGGLLPLHVPPVRAESVDPSGCFRGDAFLLLGEDARSYALYDPRRKDTVRIPIASVVLTSNCIRGTKPCLPPPLPDIDCQHLLQARVELPRSDPHAMDADGDGVGCEEPLKTS